MGLGVGHRLTSRQVVSARLLGGQGHTRGYGRWPSASGRKRTSRFFGTSGLLAGYRTTAGGRVLDADSGGRFRTTVLWDIERAAGAPHGASAAVAAAVRG